MVLESILPAKKINKNPIEMVPFSFVVSLVCIFISYFIFPSYAGVIMPLLITVTFAPLVYRLFVREEELEREEAEKKIDMSFWDRHDKTVLIFSYFFIGNFLAVFLVSAFGSESFVSVVFSQQIKEIESIRAMTTGSAIQDSFLAIIASNNMRVMFFSFLLSFIVGTGAVFILSWNASILAIFLANFIRQGLIANFFSYSAGIFPHAVIEMTAYFLSGIAGGILSVGVIREKLWSKEFLLVFRDSLILMGLAVAAVLVGAAVEVWL